MDYATQFLKHYGQTCTIARTPSVTSCVSLKRVSSRGNDPSVRDGLWEGLILADSALVSGDLFTLGSDVYLTQSAVPADGGLTFFALKCNATVTHQRNVETADTSNGNITQTWTTLATVDAWGQIVTAKLRVEDPGLLDGAKYLFMVAKVLGVCEMDRLVYSGVNYLVESVDDIAMPGVVRLQLGVDTR
jgi:hypothetical protein